MGEAASFVMTERSIHTENRSIFFENNKFILYLDAFHDDASSQHIIDNILSMASEGTELVIYLNSPGGSVNDGMALYYRVMEKFPGRITTVNQALCASMGAVTFSFGDKRIMNEHAGLMYHNYGTGASGKGGEITDYINHSNDCVGAFFRETVLDKGFLSEEEFRRMTEDNKEWWFNAKQCAERGIATHINVKGRIITSEQFLEYKRMNINIEDYLGLYTDELETTHGRQCSCN